MRRSARYALSSVAVVAALLVASVQAVEAATAHPASTTVNVIAVEYKFTLSRSTVPHGTVTFKIVNKGKIPHDMQINGKKSSLISPGKSGSFTVTFAKAGKYPYTCPVAGHTALGMKGTLKVT